LPEVRHARGVDRPLPEIWSFVEDFDNWAPMLKGYVAHTVASKTESTWTLRGELGPFSRTVNVKVSITEWRAPGRVAFTLEGLDEAVQGQGSFDLAEEPGLVVATPPVPRSWWRRLVDFVLRRPPPRPPAPPPPSRSTVVFAFGVEALGPMGPMVNALLGPWTEEVAAELLESVGTHLEKR
jgi:hypothetical protein